MNSEKMINNLLNRKTKISEEMIENQKNPEIIATTKGQNIQNLENKLIVLSLVNVQTNQSLN